MALPPTSPHAIIWCYKRHAIALQKLIKQISCEVLSSNMPLDFYLAEMYVPDAAVEKTKVICDVLSRKITIGVSVEDENDGTQEEDTA